MINVQKQTMIDFGVQKTLFTKENGKIAWVSTALNIFVQVYLRYKSSLKI